MPCSIADGGVPGSALATLAAALASAAALFPALAAAALAAALAAAALATALAATAVRVDRGPRRLGVPVGLRSIRRRERLVRLRGGVSIRLAGGGRH